MLLLDQRKIDEITKKTWKVNNKLLFLNAVINLEFVKPKKPSYLKIYKRVLKNSQPNQDRIKKKSDQKLFGLITFQQSLITTFKFSIIFVSHTQRYFKNIKSKKTVTYKMDEN